MDSLSTLFDSPQRVKLLRLFVFNRNEAFALSEITKRTRIASDLARKEIDRLIKAGFVRESAQARITHYRLDLRSTHTEALSAFIRSTTTIAPSVLLGRLKRAGTLRLAILSGVFTGVSESGIDLLVVGERLNERVLAKVTQTIEAELGREIRYASFSVEDFNYRLGIYDRLIRDVLDYPHQILLDRIGL